MMTRETAYSTTNVDSGEMPLLKLGVGVAATVIVLDQLTKLVIDTIIGPTRSSSAHWFVGEWLGFEYVLNRGIAFGIEFGNETLTMLAAAAAFLIAGVVFWRLAARDRLATVGAGLLAGGAIGNLIDRARFDGVVDFIAIGPWPRFNIADSAITIGVLLLAWCASGRIGQPQNDEEPG